MLQRLFNSPWPDEGDLPEGVKRQAAIRIRRYWAAQISLMLVGNVILWLTAESSVAPYSSAYAVPVVLNLMLLVLGLIPSAGALWLAAMVGAFAFQAMLINGLGGVTSISYMLPYTFAAMILAPRGRVALQALSVVGFWFTLVYEIVPFGPQLEARRLITVSYNILIATLTFQTLRYLNRLALELNSAYVAQEVTGRSQQFLARVSHELRTPLNSVLGFAKMLRRADLPDPQAEYLKMIVSEGEQLNQLVSDLLDSAHLATGKLRLALGPCQVNPICDAVANEIRALLRPGVALHVALSPDLPAIHADELRVRQIVRNLATNAAKYTLQGHIALSTAAHDGHVHIGVRDTGPGIPDDQHELVFVPFVKRDNRSAGVGLGLDIARQLARLHGGDIHLESTVGRGSTFTIFLPISPPPP
jgi:signal transduction histidine kinase